jgi:ABC-type multidrug transport system permease subunit
MIKILELIKKDLKLLVRARVSALVIFLGPLLLVSILGLAYSQSNTFTLTASVYSKTYTEMTESFITKLSNQNFRIIKQDSSDSCINSVKIKESEACILFSDAMQLGQDKKNEITFYVDYSQINLVWLIIDSISSRVSERSDELSKELAGNLLSQIALAEEKIKEGQAILMEVKAVGESIQQSSGGMRTGFQALDFSVDSSSLNITFALEARDNISAALSNINSETALLAAETNNQTNTIGSSVIIINTRTNDSVTLQETSEINTANSAVQSSVNRTAAAIKNNITDLTSQLAKVNTAFDLINAKLTETQTRLTIAGSQKEELLPQFSGLSEDADQIVLRVNSIDAGLNDALQQLTSTKMQDAASISSPITTQIKPIAAQKTHFNSLFPTLLVLIIMITGILLAVTLVMVDKKSRSFFRNNFTPTSYFTFDLSTYLTALFVLIIQLVLFVAVSVFFFETAIFGSIWVVLFLVLLISTVFILIGMFVGYIFRTEETANLAAVTLLAVFLLFSSIVVPLESLPVYLKNIAMFNPFVIGEMALRQTMVFQFGLPKLINSLLVLLAYALAVFLLLLLVQKAMRQMAFMQFNLNHRVVSEKKASLNLEPRLRLFSKKKDPEKDINQLLIKKD